MSVSVHLNQSGFVLTLVEHSFVSLAIPLPQPLLIMLGSQLILFPPSEDNDDSPAQI